MPDPRPIDLENVARERALERRECRYYEKCLIRAAYEAPGLWVPCAACQGTPADLPGLEALIWTFQACREPQEVPEPDVFDPERRVNKGHFFNAAELERARLWLRGKDTTRIWVNKYLCIY